MTTKKNKSLEEINQEIEEELRNYNPKTEEKQKKNIRFTKLQLIILLLILGLTLYRLFHFFF